MKRRFRMAAALAVAATLAALTGCSSASSNTTTTLQLWQSGDCKTDGTCMTRLLTDAFTKANPNIKINIVGQPTDSFQTSLQSASVTGRGPDLASIYGGSYLDILGKYTADAKKYVSPADLKSSVGAEFFAQNSSIANKVYAVPLDSQWYTGFYNKKILKANSFDAPPQNWQQLYAMSAKLKANGILPIVQGTEDTQSAQFNPLFEWSYLASALPLKDWNGLLDGTKSYDNSTLRYQLDQWHGLYTNGYINQDAFNNPNTLEQFFAGKAAMLLGGGSWLVPQMQKNLGADVGILVPPYSKGDQKTIVQFAGSGIAAMNYGKHVDEAGKFLAFILSDAGQKIIAGYGVPGTRPGSAPKGSPLFADLIKLSAKPTVTYPMFDNLSQGPVTDAINRNAAQALVGQISSSDALKALDTAVKALPEAQRKVDYKLGSK